MERANGWEALEVRHLRSFAAVAEHGSFAVAARELGYTQSAISQQVRAFERIVGASVFRRHPGGRRPVELTEEGESLLAHAHRLLARVEATRADLAAVALGEQGRVAVATTQSIGARILPAALARYRADRPRAEVEIRELTTIDDLLAAVESGVVDIAFASLPVADGPFHVQELLADPYVLVTRADRPERTLRDLEGKRLLGIRGCRHERLVEERLLADGVVVSSSERFDDNSMIQELVAAGEGVAIVPQLTIDTADPRVAVSPVPELPPRRLAIVIHGERRLRPAAHRLIDIVLEVCAGSEGRAPRSVLQSSGT